MLRSKKAGGANLPILLPQSGLLSREQNQSKEQNREGKSLSFIARSRHPSHPSRVRQRCEPFFFAAHFCGYGLNVREPAVMLRPS